VRKFNGMMRQGDNRKATIFHLFAVSSNMIWKMRRQIHGSMKNPLTRRDFCPSLSPSPMAKPSSVITAVPRLPQVFAADGMVSGIRNQRDDAPWRRFSWSLRDVPPMTPSDEEADLIRPAALEEGEEVLRTMLLSLSMDSSWNDAFALAEHYLTAAVARLFNETDPLCLVIQKGKRLVAVSLLDPDPASGNHLVSGPAVTMEYRNRGIGSRLLQASLTLLGERGLVTATGVTRDRTVAARHVYRKFGSVSESFRLSALSESGFEAKA